MTMPTEPVDIGEVLDSIFCRRAPNVVDIRSGLHSPKKTAPASARPESTSVTNLGFPKPADGVSQGASIPELRRDFSRRLAKCTDEIDALYTEALNSDGYTDDVLALDGEVVDRMARQINELKRLSKAVR